MKTIVVPTDFSDNSKTAFHYALKIAEKKEASVTLLHVFSIPVIDVGIPPDMLQAILEDEEGIEFENYKKYAEELHSLQNGHVDVKHLLRRGFVVDEIKETTEELKADLVVMGTQGASGLLEILVGSNTSAIIGNVDCPVLAVPNEANFQQISKIAYAMEFKPEEVGILDKVVEFAQLFDAELHCVHVNQGGEIWTAEQMKELKNSYMSEHPDANLQFEVIGEEDVEDALNRYMEDNHIDVLAMLTHKRNFFERLFHRSFTKKMVYHTHIPLLAFSK